MDNRPLIQIDLNQVLASKLGSKARLVPRPAVRWLERTICQDQLNDMLRRFYPKTGAEFCEAALDYLHVSVEMRNPGALPDMNSRRVIMVCNHPLGGLDGIALIAYLTRRYGPGVRFIVNDLLNAIEPLAEVFLPINKHGRQSREAIMAINQAMEGADPIVIFPAGLVSRMDSKGEVKDLEWHKMFVAKAIQHQRDVVPLLFSGRNSDRFYKAAIWRKRLGLKFNIEMIYLPREVVDSQGKSFAITAGPRIPWTELAKDSNQMATAQRVKDLTYSLDRQNH